jgi:guanylate kinase
MTTSGSLGSGSHGSSSHGFDGVERRGLMFVLSSPSGAGKTTMSRMLMQRMPNMRMSVSVTTRPIRPGEVEGRDYRFVDKARFEEMAAGGELLEWATVFDHRYGTPRLPVENALAAGHDVLFDIDWQGTQQLRERARADVVSVFLLPPSVEALEARLHSRAQDSCRRNGCVANARCGCRGSCASCRMSSGSGSSGAPCSSRKQLFDLLGLSIGLLGFTRNTNPVHFIARADRRGNGCGDVGAGRRLPNRAFPATLSGAADGFAAELDDHGARSPNQRQRPDERDQERANRAARGMPGLPG